MGGGVLFALASVARAPHYLVASGDDGADRTSPQAAARASSSATRINRSSGSPEAPTAEASTGQYRSISRRRSSLIPKKCATSCSTVCAITCRRCSSSRDTRSIVRLYSVIVSGNVGPEWN